MERRLPCEHDSDSSKNVDAKVSGTDESERNFVETSKTNQNNVQNPDILNKTELKIDLKNINKPKEVDKDGPINREDNETEMEQNIKSIPKPRIPLKRHSSSTTGEIKFLPKVNCPEKIIFCIDHSSTMFSTRFKRTLQSIKQTYVFSVLTGAMKQFIMTKSFINKAHEFSLFMLNDDAQLITDFNPQGNEVLFMLQDTVNNSQLTLEDSDAASEDDFDLCSLFDLIEHHVELPAAKSSSIPPYTVRVIFVYGRSKGTLGFKKSKESYNKLMQNPYFFIDCIYIHEEPEEINDVTDVFSCMCELDTNGTSHILEVSIEGSMSALYNAFAKLVAHPLQRQRQIGSTNLDVIAVSDCT